MHISQSFPPSSPKVESEPADPASRHIELFAGAGGMAVGCRAAGFGWAELYERDANCCRTLAANAHSATPTLLGSVNESDVSGVTWETGGPVQILAGGAPCQPFSLGGRHRADKDDRNLFPEVFRAIRALSPAAILLENVRGLLRPSFEPYFKYILAQVADPSIAPFEFELWQEHMKRIRQHQSGSGYTPEYVVSHALLNAADFGVPQLRQRVFIVALRRDLGTTFAFPNPTHSREALVDAQASGAYWDSRALLRQEKTAVSSVRIRPQNYETKPWATVRDALSSLPEPAAEESRAIMNHWRIPGARSYAGHSGSTLDWPSKTIKAGVHGVPGGENTFRDDLGQIRYYTLREAARIQSFPDHHYFVGPRTSVTRQIGNAVPCLLAEAVARQLRLFLGSSSQNASLRHSSNRQAK